MILINSAIRAALCAIMRVTIGVFSLVDIVDGDGVLLERKQSNSCN